MLPPCMPHSCTAQRLPVQVHAQPCHVVYTDFRPTPLQHYAFPLGGNGLRLVGPLKCAILTADDASVHTRSHPTRPPKDTSPARLAPPIHAYPSLGCLVQVPSAQSLQAFTNHLAMGIRPILCNTALLKMGC